MGVPPADSDDRRRRGGGRLSLRTPSDRQDRHSQCSATLSRERKMNRAPMTSIRWGPTPNRHGEFLRSEARRCGARGSTVHGPAPGQGQRRHDEPHPAPRSERLDDHHHHDQQHQDGRNFIGDHGRISVASGCCGPRGTSRRHFDMAPCSPDIRITDSSFVRATSRHASRSPPGVSTSRTPRHQVTIIAGSHDLLEEPAFHDLEPLALGQIQAAPSGNGRR